MSTSAPHRQLYEDIGGRAAFEQLVRRFYEGVRTDDVLAPMYPEDDFDGAIERLTMFLEQYWGGPSTYSDTRGHPRLRMRHAPYRVTPEARDRWLHHMRAGVDELAFIGSALGELSPATSPLRDVDIAWPAGAQAYPQRLPDLYAGEPLLRLRRLRLGNAAPIGIQTAHLPAALVPGLYETATAIDSLYETLRTRFGIAPVKAKEVYRVGQVQAEDAELIQQPAGTPAFVVERIAYSSRGPFELTLSTMRADRYEIRSTLYI